MKLRRSLNFFAFVILAGTSGNAVAGIKWIDVGVNGLTCSMCTRSVEMSIRKLDFVDTVIMSLETTEGRIYLKADVPGNLEQIAKAIVNAGFSVRFIKMRLSLDDVKISQDGIFISQSQTFKWIDYKGKAEKSVTLKLINEGFLPRNEASKFKKLIDSGDSVGSIKFLHVIQEG